MYVGIHPAALCIHLRDDVAVDAVEVFIGDRASAPFGDAMAERVHSIAGCVAVVVVGREQIAEAVVKVLILVAGARTWARVEQIAGKVIAVIVDSVGPRAGEGELRGDGLAALVLNGVGVSLANEITLRDWTVAIMLYPVN